jgi:hypothetical protein
MPLSPLRRGAATATALVLVGLSPITPARADGAACLTAAHANDSVKSFNAIVTETINGKTFTTAEDFVKPDRMHVVGTGVEIYTIGNKTWQRSNGGAWKVTTSSDPLPDMTSMASKLSKSQIVSCTESAGLWRGQPAHIFHSTTMSAKGATVKMTEYVLGDGYIHHLEIVTASAPVAMDFSKFNTTTVNPP